MLQATRAVYNAKYEYLFIVKPVEGQMLGNPEIAIHFAP